MKKTLLIAVLLSFSILSAQEKPAEKNTTGIDGYGNLSWGTVISDARDKTAGTLVFTDEKKVILTKDGHIKYYYGFFYKDPELEPEKKEADGGKTDTAEKPASGKLYYISVTFPYLSMESVKEKIVKKYGPETSENMKNNRGAVIWDSEKTIIIMWIDAYEKKPFCRRISYISKEIAKEAGSYQESVFNKTEQEIIKKLTP